MEIKNEWDYVKIPGVDESLLNEEERIYVDLVKRISHAIAPQDYPIKGEIIRFANPDGSITEQRSDVYAPRHICQGCGKLLDASDLLDYVCNKCGGVDT